MRLAVAGRMYVSGNKGAPERSGALLVGMGLAASILTAKPIISAIAGSAARLPTCETWRRCVSARSR